LTISSSKGRSIAWRVMPADRQSWLGPDPHEL
jgi:hypothetical protein